MNNLIVDIGNTNVVVALSRNGRMSRRTRVTTGVSDLDETKAIVARVCNGARMDGAGLSSVVPRVNRRWTAAIRQVLGCKPVTLQHTLELGVGIDYPAPASIGADRLANASGALALYGAPVIVADFGTALTFDVIDGAGCYIGGVITPGLPFMSDYLADKTALLPHIQLRGGCPKIGKSTEQAMRIGAKIGYRGMVREITGYLLAGIKGRKPVTLCATGGFAEWALQGLEMGYIFNPDLTLYGIHRICELNGR